MHSHVNAAIFCLLSGALGFSSLPAGADSPHDRHGAAVASDRGVGGREMASWSTRPLLLPLPGGSGERSVLRYRGVGLEASALTVFGPAPGAAPAVLPPRDGVFEVRQNDPKVGNYHWLQARGEEGREVRVANTVAYFSNPGPAPTALLAQARSELELVPEPLPREHGQYRESEKWTFLVRFQGQPLANQPVLLETEAGTRMPLASDAEGRVRVLFPRDMVTNQVPSQAPGRVAAGGHGRTRPGGFVLSTLHESGGRRYLTAFNGSYGPDPERSRSLAAGAGFGLLGMVLAVPLLRRPRSAAPDSSGATPHA